MYKYLCIILFSLFFFCHSKQNKNIERNENIESKATLQGMWLDENTESPVLQIKGDSIYYFASSISPVSFKVFDDSLITYGEANRTSYQIIKQSTYTLWLQTEIGDLIQLSKVDNTTDSIIFPKNKIEKPKQSTEVIQKDHVVFYNNVRYRGYVYINPSQIKVIRPEYSEEGFQVDNVYYDNIIHICVYEGKNKLFGKDIMKKDFEGIIPDDFLQWSILSDMDFKGVNEKGYQYQASICIPNEASCYLVNISISEKGELSYTLVE